MSAVTTSGTRPTVQDASAPPSPPQAAPRRRGGPLAALLALSRPYQWAKNPLAVALALITMPVWDTATVLGIAWSTGLFVLASVAVYVLNDVLDRHRDGLHPVKRHRPLASGRLRVSTALAYLAVVCALFAGGVVLASPARCWPVLVYLGLNLAYSLRLKHIPLIDAFCVALGFVLRTLQGYTAVGVPASGWLLLTVFAVCLLLVFGKRRHELAQGNAAHRPALRGYTVPYLDHLTVMSATLATVGYLLCVRSEMALRDGTATLVLLTVPCAFFAVFRYLQLLVVGQGGADPVRTLSGDRLLVGSGLLWGALTAVCLAALH
ncbi:UbiA prenyltransferase family protein [Streptomyces sp. AK08-02]|uniref:UbiA prenyltransferase family protein n=1 Tax=Streptomyces sp. AK08-02 TaxID=3028654 RepID=UPI0029AF0C4C|nr:UbiA prenyltransferase family protein [Streptomyces sp. AK08-02]MDX3747360.1 UbiA prenyltransferase family protein [Streptomyces sp. AK08-02]